MSNNRETMIKTLHKLAKKDSDIYFVCMDGIESTHFEEIRKDIGTERIINCGISEQNAVGFSAGLSLQGKKVFIICCAFFLTTRAYEQIKLDLAYNNANVTILAIKSGIASDVSGGYSHWGADDIGLLKDLPNTVIANCATMNELQYYIEKSTDYNGFMYIADEWPGNTFNPLYKIEQKKFSKVIDGNDFIIIATGNALKYAWNLTQQFYSKGKRALLLSAHSIKPFDKEGLIKLINKNIPIITIDEHTAGGLTSITSQIIAEYGKPVRYLPVYVSTEECNLVGGYSFIAQRTMHLDSIFNRIENILDKKRKSLFSYFLTNKIKFIKDGRKNITYYLFGCLPILKTKQRPNNTKKKIKNKYYLFGFIKII